MTERSSRGWSRRNLLRRGAATAAGAVAASTLAGGHADAHVMQPGQWKAALYDSIVDQPRRIKATYQNMYPQQFYLQQSVNWLNSMHFSYEIPEDQILLVAALYGGANIMNYNDVIWARYRLGEMFRVTDPATREPATRNVFWPMRSPGDPSAQPSDPRGFWQDQSIQALQRRGALFLT